MLAFGLAPYTFLVFASRKRLAEPLPKLAGRFREDTALQGSNILKQDSKTNDMVRSVRFETNNCTSSLLKAVTQSSQPQCFLVYIEVKSQNLTLPIS